MISSDENTKAEYLEWSNAFTKDYGALCLTNGDTALAASDYDRAIALYSAVIDLTLASDTIFVKRSKARLAKTLWTEALLDARKQVYIHGPDLLSSWDERRSKRLQWASSRVTTLQEDVAYSLFGIFGVHLPVVYGEKKQNALGRLLQEIVARSGDITILDWVGQPSEFNSCLPAYITSYATPPRTLPSLSEDQIQTTISSLRKNLMVW
ncbi:hypothetical protein C8R48DRAFT_763921 [Suillus tomentosus]|nr:hypothetical protein C8R48DRAFT_763921 [Suillus tomentosus]